MSRSLHTSFGARSVCRKFPASVKTEGSLFAYKSRLWNHTLRSMMPSSGMLRRVALLRTDVSEEHIASIISCYKSHTAEHPRILHSSSPYFTQGCHIRPINGHIISRPISTPVKINYNVSVSFYNISDQLIYPPNVSERQILNSSHIENVLNSYTVVRSACKKVDAVTFGNVP
jgi:hypothetical protein